VIAAPTVEPVTPAECKLDARVDNDVEDGLFAMWIGAARQEIEMVARRALITRTLEVTLDAWPVEGWLPLSYPPLLTVTQITYYSATNVLTTWAASQYIVIADQEPGVVMPATGVWWPTNLHAWPRIRVRYTAGYGATAIFVPDYYKQDIRGLVKLQYDFRSGWTPDAERARALIYAHAQMDRGW
jgi:uncharacterized phiE125 gp8 family phage protein